MTNRIPDKQYFAERAKEISREPAQPWVWDCPAELADMLQTYRNQLGQDWGSPATPSEAANFLAHAALTLLDLAYNGARLVQRDDDLLLGPMEALGTAITLMHKGILSYRINGKARNQLNDYVSDLVASLEPGTDTVSLAAILAACARWMEEQGRGA